jgi:hypothetical protein
MVTIILSALTGLSTLFALWAWPVPKDHRNFGYRALRTQRGRWTRVTIALVLAGGSLIYGRFVLTPLTWVQVATLALAGFTALRVYRRPAYWHSKHLARSGDYEYVRM